MHTQCQDRVSRCGRRISERNFAQTRKLLECRGAWQAAAGGVATRKTIFQLKGPSPLLKQK